MSFVRLGCDLILPNDQRIAVDLAETQEQRRDGLKGRRVLAPDEGMLFVFGKPGLYAFTMNGMLISVDMIWIGSDFSIVQIVEGARPSGPVSTYGGNKSAAYVLELGAGGAKRYGLRVGQRLRLGAGGLNG